MMLADAVEATSRTVGDPTLENFKRMVSRIVFNKLAEGQLDESGLTVKDLKVVAHTFAESLHFSRHKRVKYQWQVKEEAEEQRQIEEESSPPTRPSTPPEPRAEVETAQEDPSRPSAPAERLDADSPSSEISVEVTVGEDKPPKRKKKKTFPNGLAADSADRPDASPKMKKAQTSTLTGIGSPVKDDKKGETD
jgi:hypothetical protein